MKSTKPVLVILAALLSSGVASASLKVSLVTVSPGPIVFESFGHSALLVENSDTPAAAMLYEYGAVNPQRVFMASDPMVGFNNLFESKIKTNALKTATPMVDIGNNQSFPVVLKQRYLQPRADFYREIRISPLNLTDAQATKFVELVDKDIAAGEYFYDNYDNNCATKVRDRLFDDAVLGSAERNALDVFKVDMSIQQIVFEAMDEAISLNPNKRVELMPAALARSARGRQAMMVLGMIGLKDRFSSTKEFYDAVANADGQLASLMPDEPVTKSFHSYFFGTRLTEKPISTSRTMFMPKYLRAAVVKASNPALEDKPLVDASKEILRTTTDEINAMEAARKAAIAAQAPAAAAAQ